MRLLFLTLFLVSLGSLVSATYSSKTVKNYLAYAGHISHEFALGETGNASGWRQCTEAEATPQTRGVVCEGVRSIHVRDGQRMDVSYNCELQFREHAGGDFSVISENCQ